MSDLVNLVGQSFKKSRHGVNETVVLENVGRNRVSVRNVDTNVYQRLSIAKFEKLYRKIQPRGEKA